MASLRSFFGAAAVAAASSAIVVRNTTNGLIQGESTGGISYFRSVPFAAPPTGPLRFRAPAPPASWDGVLDTTPAATPCAQLKIDGTVYYGSEDCLYLSVTVPENATGPLPVLVWIYGGAYILGDEIEFGWYDPTNLVTKSSYIVVAGNYRLGPFGFMALDALQSEDPAHSTGNAALQDQTAVLQWVHDNIANFGGDPSRVTIFGESAGGFSVCWHLVSQASAGLFSHAIMESGSCDSNQFFQPVDDAIAFNTLYASAIGCNSSVLGTGPALVECLRNVSSEAVMKSLLDMLNPNWPFTSSQSAYGSTNLTAHMLGLGVPRSAALRTLPALAPLFPWGPAIDGASTGLLDLPLNLIRSGSFNKVPLILGTNLNEGTIFVPTFPLVIPGTTFPPRNADIPLIIEHAYDMFNSSVVASLVNNVIMPLYPPYPLDDNWARASDILTHTFFSCAARRAARAVSAAGVPVFLYQFSHHLSWIEYVLLGDYHTSELFFVWRNQWPPILHDFDAQDWAMADAISAFWLNFASSGNPNDGPFTVNMAWPQYDAALDINMQLQVPLNVTQNLLQTQCNMWDSVQTALGPAPRKTRF